MSAPTELRVMFQAQYWHANFGEWWDAGEPHKTHEYAKAHLSAFLNNPCRLKTRIIKLTTTFEVVEEMEPKCN